MATRFEIALATPRDDAALRQRMAKNRMEGDMVLSFRREPDYFAGCKVQGDDSQIIKCTDRQSGSIVGLGARHSQRLFVNGRESRVGYLSDLRADAAVRRQTLLARGYAFLRELHHGDPLPLYFSVILEGNDAATEALSGARAGLPIYEERGRICTPAIHLDRRMPPLNCTGITVQRASPELLPRIFAFLQKELACKQLAPCYADADMVRGRLQGLCPQDIYVALRGNSIVGSVAAWNQSGFRQTHVEQYSRRLQIVRPFYNVAARFSALHSLPSPGERIPFLYLGLVATENNRVDIFASLLRAVYRDRRAGECHFMIAGLHENDPLCATLEDYRRIDAGGRLFLIYYPEFSDFVKRLDQRTFYIEMASV